MVKSEAFCPKIRGILTLLHRCFQIFDRFFCTSTEDLRILCRKLWFLGRSFGDFVVSFVGFGGREFRVLGLKSRLGNGFFRNFALCYGIDF